MRNLNDSPRDLKMMIRSAFLLTSLAFSTPLYAAADLERGFSGALTGCEEWILNPTSWAEGVAPFVSKVGLGDKMGLVESIDDALQPPEGLRLANHYWRINSTENAGYMLVVSDRLPMCHITGGGATDLQPIVESVLSAEAFLGRWEKVAEKPRGDMISTEYRNREEPALTMVVSRASDPGQRLDRVQVLATAQMMLEN